VASRILSLVRGGVVTFMVLGLFWGVSAASAQEARGAIVGRITDATGAVVPGASVKLTNLSTGVTMATQANEQGAYQALYLIPAVYRVSVEMQGFKSFLREGVELRVSDRLALDVTLEVGNLSETLTVTSETPLLETTNASIGQVVDARRVAELPIAHGNPYLLIQLTAGVAFGRTLTFDRPFEPTHIVGYTFGGTRTNRAELTMDGMPSSATANANEVTAAWTPPSDVVSETRIQTASFDASVGNTEGGVVNISLRSGTRDFHGTAYLFKQDPSLNANLFFSNRIGQPRGDFTYSRWGGVSTGPVILPKLYHGRSRTFYMWGYEGMEESRARGSIRTVPTAKQREGDFSDLLRVGSQYQIYDPASRRSIAGGRYQSDPFAGNLMPPARISPIARKILSYYDLPNIPGSADGRNNLDRSSEPEPIAYYTHTVRVDHNFSDRHRVYSRVSFNKRTSHNSTWFHNITQGQWQDFQARAAAFDDVYTLSPTFVMNWRLSYNRYIRFQDANPESYGFDLTTLGLPAAYNSLIDPTIRRFPQIVIGVYQGTYSGASDRRTDLGSLIGAFDKVQGAHSLKFGVEYRAYRENQNSCNAGCTGNLQFGTNWTRGPLDSSSAAPIGQDLASLVLGLPTGGYVDRLDSYAEQSTVWSAYFQDDWRITPRLTFNLGLRYELEGPLTERFNRTIRGFDFNAALPIAAQVQANYALSPTPEVPPSQFQVRGGLLFAGVGGQPRTLWERDKNNLMPRFGFAYSLSKRTVLRGGYGIFFGALGARRGDVLPTGFNQRTTLVPSLDNGLTFVATLANPFPDGIQVPPRASLGPMTYVGQGITFFNSRPLAPYMQRWQLSLQRELPHRVVFDLGYVGNRGTHITTFRNLGAFPTQYLSRSPERDQQTINYLSANLPNPFYPLLPGTQRDGRNIQRSALLQPYPQFTTLGLDTNEGYSWYHSLQARLEKRFSAGYTLLATYTWSKFMEATGFLNDGASVEKVISNQDFPHVLSVSAIYELPFGRGRRWASQAPGLAEKFIGGWQVQGIYRGQSGPALGFGNVIFRGNLADIVLPKNQRSVERWFNTDAGFERNSSRALAANWRTLSTQFTGLRGDGINNWDLSVIKNTRISESKRVEFRAEFLNAFNHALFIPPDVNPYSAAFGSVQGEAGNPRRIQLGLRFVY